MEIVIQLLSVFIMLHTAVKFSFWKVKFFLGISILLGIISLIMYPYTIEQSQTQMEEWIYSPKMMENVAVWVSVEAGLGMAFGGLTLLKIYQNKYGKWQKVLQYYPCLLMVPVLFYGLTQMMFVFTGVDFFTIAVGFSGVVTVGLPLLVYGVQVLMPEVEMRLEIQFLLSIFVAILGLIGTQQGEMMYPQTNNGVDFKDLIFIVLSVFLLAVVGFFGNKCWWYYQSRKR